MLLFGRAPHPAVAFLTADLAADLGVVISASHNPMPDNGIKIFAAGGVKLDDAVEDAIESGMDDHGRGCRPTGATGSAGSSPWPTRDRRATCDHLQACVHRTRWPACAVVVDCANGAASAVAPAAYRRAGAEVVRGRRRARRPRNINDGVGSTHLEVLRAAVLEHGADLGIAHDGDADRCLAIAADGQRRGR